MRPPTGKRTYEVRTYGCQMNVHDSERLTGLLEDAGYAAAPAGEQADVVVFNTCAVRENADNKLYGNLCHLAPVKAANPGMQIAVGGCLAQKDRATITAKAPYVDVVFGTHNIGSLPVLLERARVAGGGAGRDPRVARGLPLDAADQARVGVRRLGVDLGRVQQHLHVLHRARRCAARRRTAVPARSSPRSRRWSPTASPRSRCWARTSTPTAWSSATGRRSPSCCAPAATSRGSSGCGSPARTPRSSPTT